MNARVSQLFGGRSGTTTLASAATMYIPDNTSVIYVTGTTTVTSLLLSDRSSYNRIIFFAGGSGCLCNFTNTNTPTTEGQMSLRGSNQQLTEGVWMALYVGTDRTWQLVFGP